MSSKMLEDVRVAFAAGKKCHFGAIHAYVTGYVVENEFPRKFVYRGCTEDNGYGFTCCKSLEQGPCRDHGEGGTWSYMYRFDIYVVDPSITYMTWPLCLTIFDAASSLIRMSPDKFQEKDLVNQMELVHAATQRLNIIYLYISFNPSKDTFPIVERLETNKDAGARSYRIGSRTPVQSPLPAATSQSALRLAPTDLRSPTTTSTSENVPSQNDVARKLLFELIEVFGRSTWSRNRLSFLGFRLA